MSKSVRNGMWVKTDAGVGIIIREQVAVKADGSRRLFHGEPRKDESVEREWWVHLTNADGTTLTQVPIVAVGKLEQASLDDIPAPRRPSEAVAKRLGY